MRALWITLGSTAGFVTGFILAAIVGLNETVSSECDGPCFKTWDDVVYIAIAVGLAAAVTAGFVVRSVLNRRRP